MKLPLLSTFIFLIYFNSVNSNCGSYLPRVASQCHEFTNEFHFCCLLTRFMDSFNYNVCHSIPRQEYPKFAESGFINLGVNNYTQINCGEEIGSSCSKYTPLVPDDCYNFNSSKSNCCFVKIPGNKNRCIYSGHTNSGKFTTTNGISIKCLKK